ncbi:MAG: Asp-tRNA(Asn)/Glu-tRNA(Gln) amidotransferase subunit GatB [Candidatus Paceibacterota bacterium]
MIEVVSDYETTIGLEIHVELDTESKMFCNCKNDSHESHPNVNICPICLGHPGTLPVINREAVKRVIKSGLALNCDILEKAKFDRKNYFYPDLPKGYQISQYDLPLCGEGYLEIEGEEITIRRIHLEEDTGKLIHSNGNSLVDFNRAGVPLMELVTEPDLKSAEQAKKFAQELRLILRYLGVSQADMEQGEMRCEANISISDSSDKGTKVEIKNLNSFKAMERGIEYEVKRQRKRLEKGEEITQATRGWDEEKQKTFAQREKEMAHDYRYFPEPDLPPLETKELVEEIRKEIPELPAERRERFSDQYGLDQDQVKMLTERSELGEYFEQVVSELKNWANIEEVENKRELINLAANYIITDLVALLKESSSNAEELSITPENFAELIIMTYKDEISSKAAKKVLKEMFGSGNDPSKIVEEKDLKQISDDEELRSIVQQVISENEDAVGDYHQGKEEALKFLLGKVMGISEGRADPELARKLLKEELES